MAMKKNKKTSSTKRTYFITDEGVVVFKTITDGPTSFPEKLARANEFLKKAKLLPPVTKK